MSGNDQFDDKSALSGRGDDQDDLLRGLKRAFEAAPDPVPDVDADDVPVRKARPSSELVRSFMRREAAGEEPAAEVSEETPAKLPQIDDSWWSTPASDNAAAAAPVAPVEESDAAPEVVSVDAAPEVDWDRAFADPKSAVTPAPEREEKIAPEAIDWDRAFADPKAPVARAERINTSFSPNLADDFQMHDMVPGADRAAAPVEEATGLRASIFNRTPSVDLSADAYEPEHIEDTAEDNAAEPEIALEAEDSPVPSVDMAEVVDFVPPAFGVAHGSNDEGDFWDEEAAVESLADTPSDVDGVAEAEAETETELDEDAEAAPVVDEEVYADSEPEFADQEDDAPLSEAAGEDVIESVEEDISRFDLQDRDAQDDDAESDISAEKFDDGDDAPVADARWDDEVEETVEVSALEDVADIDSGDTDSGTDEEAMSYDAYEAADDAAPFDEAEAVEDVVAEEASPLEETNPVEDVSADGDRAADAPYLLQEPIERPQEVAQHTATADDVIADGFGQSAAFDEDAFDEEFDAEFENDAEPEPVNAPVAAQVAAPVDEPAPDIKGDQTIAPMAASIPTRLVDQAKTRRPRVCLMGEFSAGKSTLSNLLIGSSAVPVNVTATQLPPVWLSYGNETPYRVDLDEQEHEIALEHLEQVSVHDTHHIKIFKESKLLQICDLIDMPGISDPNMAADVWQRVIHHADIVIWCSHATQAWRQSEAAVWGTMPKELYDKSILLLTRMDRILSERDRVRVVRRVEKEAGSMFRKVLPVSLLQALEAGDDAEVFAECGAQAMTEALVEVIDEVAGRRPKTRIRSQGAPVDAIVGEELKVAKPRRVIMPTRVRAISSETRMPTRSRGL